MKKLFITVALFLATTSAYAGHRSAHNSPRSNYNSSVSNDEFTVLELRRAALELQLVALGLQFYRAHGTTRRRRTTIRTTSPSPQATLRRARTTTRHTRATIRHVRILVHDAKETRLLPTRIRTTKRLDPVRRSSGLRPRGMLDLAIAKGWLALHEIRHLMRALHRDVVQEFRSQRDALGKAACRYPVCRAFTPAFGSLRQRVGGGLAPFPLASR